MGWLINLIQLVQLVPTVISVVEQIISIINGHPAGKVAGVAAVKARLDAPLKDKSLESKVGSAPDLVTD
jgi:ribulose 1,5-bisphosphate carboxylase large subunit-like protein